MDLQRHLRLSSSVPFQMTPFVSSWHELNVLAYIHDNIETTTMYVEHVR